MTRSLRTQYSRKPARATRADRTVLATSEVTPVQEEAPVKLPTLPVSEKTEKPLVFNPGLTLPTKPESLEEETASDVPPKDDPEDTSEE